VLIADVYEALRNSPPWEQTLLAILWDEHGGIFDHAFPKQPQVPCPDGKVSVDPLFGFDLVGVRVPAVLVSPYIVRGTVDHTQYEHASIPATVKTPIRVVSVLTARDEASNSFESIVSLSAARLDTPAMLPRIAGAANAAARANKLPFLLNTAQQLEAEAAGVISRVPLSDFQESLADMASRITTAGTIATTAIKETPRREHAAGEHVRTLASEYFGIPEEQTKFDDNAASRM
jgi:hypothetical protein